MRTRNGLWCSSPEPDKINHGAGRQLLGSVQQKRDQRRPQADRQISSVLSEFCADFPGAKSSL